MTVTAYSVRPPGMILKPIRQGNTNRRLLVRSFSDPVKKEGNLEQIKTRPTQ